MLGLVELLLGWLTSLVKSRRRLRAEKLVLRHQLNILRRKLPVRMGLSSADRRLFVWLSRPTGEASARMLGHGASPWDTLSAALASGIYGPQYHMTPTIKSVTIAARSMATKWGIVSTPSSIRSAGYRGYLDTTRDRAHRAGAAVVAGRRGRA